MGTDGGGFRQWPWRGLPLLIAGFSLGAGAAGLFVTLYQPNTLLPYQHFADSRAERSTVPGTIGEPSAFVLETAFPPITFSEPEPEPAVVARAGGALGPVVPLPAPEPGPAPAETGGAVADADEPTEPTPNETVPRVPERPTEPVSAAGIEEPVPLPPREADKPPAADAPAPSPGGPTGDSPDEPAAEEPVAPDGPGKSESAPGHLKDKPGKGNSVEKQVSKPNGQPKDVRGR